MVLRRRGLGQLLLLCCPLSEGTGSSGAAAAFIPSSSSTSWRFSVGGGAYRKGRGSTYPPGSIQPATTTTTTTTTRLNLFDIKSLFGGGGGGSKQDGDEDVVVKEYAPGVWGKGVPSMDDLWREAWPTEACQDMMKMREEMNTGIGPPHFDKTVRSFGGNETTYNIFYRDSSGWCPYCQSVWMVLEEKRLPYKVKKVNLLAYGEKPEWFFRVSPSGLLPVVEVDGRIVRESIDIMRLVDWWRGSLNQGKMYPPKGTDLQKEAESLLSLERDLYREWFIWLFESPEEKGREAFLDTLDKVETALGVYPGPWFLGGKDPSLVDCTFAPKVERMVASCLYSKGLRIRAKDSKYTHINKWLDALDRRPSYSAFKSDYYTINQSLPPQFGRVYASPNAKAYSDEIDGKASSPSSSSSPWTLPVSYSDDDLEYIPPDLRPDDTLTRQAVAVKLIVGHKRVPRYMLRALGRPGYPPLRSPLSDPYNTPPPESVLPSIEAAYRWLILSLLRGTDAVGPLVQEEIQACQQQTGGGGGGAKGGGRGEDGRWAIIKCLGYLRDRVGVPRDMTLPEARHLRAHLNWLIAQLQQQQQ